MRRREFLGLVGGTAMFLPQVGQAQPSSRTRHIAVLMSTAAEDPESAPRRTALLQGLERLGWINGVNVEIEMRWSGGNAAAIRKHAAELATLDLDIIVAPGSATLAPLVQATRSIPIVFVHVPDPVGAGFVDSLARPGGNVTGFIAYEYGLSTKWLELLKQMMPTVKRAAVIRDPAIPSGLGQYGAIQAVAPSLGVEVRPVNVRDATEIERTIAEFSRTPDSGLVVTGSALAQFHRDLIITLAARHKLPTIYFERFFVVGGGLISYGPDLVDQYRRAAEYVDRILKGEKPADLPVQAPTKYELVINLKTAKALGLTVPPSLLARAEEVIE